MILTLYPELFFHLSLAPGTQIANRLRPTGGLSGGKWTLNVTIQRRTFVSLPVS
jgi:hypothetical protein